MAIKESLLTVVNSISDSDFVRAVTSAGASRKLSVSNLARHIVETYSGSTIAGSAQSVKSAVDAVKALALDPNLNYATVSATSQSALETALLSRLNAMNDGEIKMIVVYPDYTGSFTNGSRSVGVLYRYSSTVFKCEILGSTPWEGYYYSSAWHWDSTADSLNSNTEITGITAGPNISTFEALNIFKTGRMVTGNIIFQADAELAATDAIIASGLPSANYRRQVNGVCIAGSLVGQSTRFAVYQGNLTTYWSNSVPANTTWNVTFAYPV